MASRVDYHQYMASREWRLKRQEVAARRGDGLCERCLQRPFENIHHLSYKHLGREELDELVAVCRPCHRFLSAEQDDDPAVQTVLTSIARYGLQPVFHGDDNNWSRFANWETGPEDGPTFIVEFHAKSPEPPDYIPWAFKFQFSYDVWWLCYWM